MRSGFLTAWLFVFAGGCASGEDAGKALAPSICSKADAGTVIFCETFDTAAEVPPELAPAITIPATIAVDRAKALSAPHALRIAFGDPGPYNSATGAATKTTFEQALARSRLDFAIHLEGVFGGEVDVLQMTWKSATEDYWIRFGTNGGRFWTFTSSGLGAASFTAFPTEDWYRVVVEVDLDQGRYTVTAGEVRIFDQPTLAEGFAPLRLELSLGAPAVSTSIVGPSAVLVDDVLLTTP